MSNAYRIARPCLFVGGLLLLAGCSGGATQPPKDGKKDDKSIPAEHGHKPGKHGGTLVSIGTDSYHAEAVFEKGGTLRLYLLGQDEARILEVETQTLSAFVKAAGDAEAEPLTLAPDPTDDDAREKTSRFVGKLPERLAGKNVEVTVTNLRVGKDRFRFSFQSAGDLPGHAAMPAPTADERKLYLTAGGKYTDDDIKANGNTVPSIKFKGVKVDHDDSPKPGERICPISKTKANPALAWVVGGKSYTFCCPPCLDEFLERARDKPETILEPDAYRKK